MASSINSTSAGNGGLVSTGDDSGILNIQTNETTAITVDASQIVSYTNNLGTVAGYPAYQCRAWVNFNGQGTVSIRASGNVSSITDNGVGNHTINFTTAMTDANYSLTGTAALNGGVGSGSLDGARFIGQYSGSTSNVRIVTCYQNVTTEDCGLIQVAIFR